MIRYAFQKDDFGYILRSEEEKIENKDEIDDVMLM